jgi:quercetin dioxygenase-like cupin family protein
MTQTPRDRSRPGAVVQRTVDAGGFAFRQTALRPWLRLPDHAHHQATLLVVLSGSYHETVEGRSQSYPPLTVIAKPPGQKHSNDQRGQTASCVEIEVSDRRLTSLQRYARLFDRRTVLQGRALEAIVLRTAQELVAPDELSVLSLEGLALEMIATAARPEPSPDARTERRWLDEVRTMLDSMTSPPALSAMELGLELFRVFVSR